jgi:thioester reductase-like protein
MSDSDYDYWVQHSDAVVHAAADIRLSRGDKSAIINAQACKEIFEFTDRGVKNPSLHFTSSIASCGIQLQSEYATETSDHPFEAAFPGGYGRQKWEAERFLVEKAAESSTLVSIYRVPSLSIRKGFNLMPCQIFSFRLLRLLEPYRKQLPTFRCIAWRQFPSAL